MVGFPVYASLVTVGFSASEQQFVSRWRRRAHHIVDEGPRMRPKSSKVLQVRECAMDSR